jgi:hypothetical protein
LIFNKSSTVNLPSSFPTDLILEPADNLQQIRVVVLMAEQVRPEDNDR